MCNDGIEKIVDKIIKEMTGLLSDLLWKSCEELDDHIAATNNEAQEEGYDSGYNEGYEEALSEAADEAENDIELSKISCPICGHGKLDNNLLCNKCRRTFNLKEI